MAAPDRPMRADAVRTRKALVAAAAAVFAESGVDATTAEVAARAGIGKGTVFRHFPTKDDLLAAIVAAAVDELVADGERLAAHDDAAAALREFLYASAALNARNRALVDALDRADADRNPKIQAQVERLVATAEQLAARARRAGAVHPDVRGLDIVMLTCGIHHASAPLADEEPDVWERYVDIVFAGLREDQSFN
ncbi:TetR/AcrR family transcriptional regulator [Nocardia wallacei]|uniref:TetR family transcriptional regulator n=1 Tax=Nocardia wallacei TaxID=480035 RepID=A0A7G1KSI9_9NOCA|nr:TetR/AcrR family transcriptional regulator [Nocardia wallacei]BCK56174.1 TetR family transcriptional regulator [Nocardia wallacei]